jgi:hypothetical protein
MGGFRAGAKIEEMPEFGKDFTISVKPLNGSRVMPEGEIRPLNNFRFMGGIVKRLKAGLQKLDQKLADVSDLVLEARVITSELGEIEEHREEEERRQRYLQRGKILKLIPGGEPVAPAPPETASPDDPPAELAPGERLGPGE